MSTLPKKLKDDAIIEALAEARFESDELPEIILGRLSDVELWKSFKKKRLPASDIPAPIRAADANLKFQAALELRNEESTRVVKIGPNVLSYHVIGAHQYVGWDNFEPLLRDTFKVLFETVENVSVARMGLRYTNALTLDRHFVTDVPSLNLEIEVAGDPVEEPVNINYQIQNGNQHRIMTRIGSPDFIQGKLPEGTTAIVDVDVFTLPGYAAQTLNEVMVWIDQAHEFEKQAFFRLIPDDIVDRLAED